MVWVAIGLSVLLHSLVFELVLHRVHVDPLRTSPVPVTLITELEDVPSEIAISAPPAAPPKQVGTTNRRQPRHRVALSPAPVETASPPIATEPSPARASDGAPDAAASPLIGASLGTDRRVFADGDVDSAAHPALRIQPRYPERARLMGRESDVKLTVIVEPDGRVSHVELLSSGGEEFDREAEDALEHTRFVPARKAGEPVAALVNFTVHFRLDE